MCNLLVITIHKTNQILFVKCTYIDIRLIIETINKVRVLYDHHPFCSTFINHIVCKTLLVFLGECVVRS